MQLRTLTFMSRALLSLTLALIPLSNVFSAEVTFRSRPEQVSLVELYTSEGCSSCPPAETWLADLRRDPGLWTDFVPIAFHVNYWDHLGWRDVFATREFTQREYRYAEAWGSASVYTPCFVRNGEEWKSRSRPAPKRSMTQVGELAVTPSGSGEFRVAFSPHPAANNLPAKLEVSVALLGGGITSSIRAGENSGKELRHEFVVLALTTVTLARSSDGKFAAAVHVVAPTDRAFPTMARRALAAWISPASTLMPLQATGGWLEP